MFASGFLDFPATPAGTEVPIAPSGRGKIDYRT
jgi:hypothetical protein